MNKSNFFFCQQQNFVHYNDNTNKWHKFFASKFALKTKTQVTFEIIHWNIEKTTTKKLTCDSLSNSKIFIYHSYSESLTNSIVKLAVNC